jgi:spermidine synthase
VRTGRRRRPPVPAPVELRTPYALAAVVAEPARPSRRTLLLDGHEAGQVDLADPRALGFGYMRRIADVLDAIAPPDRALDAVHIGGGAFALPRYLAATRPRSRQEVLERDPGVVRLARERLGLRPSPRLRTRVGDAAALLPARPDRSADVVIGDAFDGPDVPPALASAKFVADVRRALRPTGVYVLNVIDAPPLDAARAHVATLAAAFVHVAAIAPPGVLRGRSPGNLVLVASAAPLPLARLRRATAAAVPREQVVEGAALCVSGSASRARG